MWRLLPTRSWRSSARSSRKLLTGEARAAHHWKRPPLHGPNVEAECGAAIGEVDLDGGVRVHEPIACYALGAGEQVGTAGRRRVEFAEGGEQDFECQTLAAAFAELARRSPLCRQQCKRLGVLIPINGRNIDPTAQVEGHLGDRGTALSSFAAGGFFHAGELYTGSVSPLCSTLNGRVRCLPWSGLRSLRFARPSFALFRLRGLVLRSCPADGGLLFDPLVHVRTPEPPIATKPESRNRTLVQKMADGLMMAVQIVGDLLERHDVADKAIGA